MSISFFQQMSLENKWTKEIQRNILLESALLSKVHNFYEFIQQKTRATGIVKFQSQITIEDLSKQHLRRYRKLCHRYIPA
jgi:hypothetical protein